MDIWARRSNAEREELFREAANSKGVHFQIIEKDFWVCWTLKRLFGLSAIGQHLIFKGGTSLSKGYGLIERFSEDIDVSIYRSLLGFGDDAELGALSSNKRKQWIKDLDAAGKEFVHNDLLFSLRMSFQEEIPDSDFDWQLLIAKDDPFDQTLLFEYPRNPNNELGNELDYLKPFVRIEMGARPTNEPVEVRTIQSYASEEFPAVFEQAAFELSVLSGERTFWEKATILHEQFHRDDDYKSAERLSRHYYDLFKLKDSDVATKALANRGLLARVVENKKLLFTRAGANYDDAVVGRIRLVPSEARVKAFKTDYEKMSMMFFSTPPKFEDIISSLRELEEKINAAA